MLGIGREQLARVLEHQKSPLRPDLRAWAAVQEGLVFVEQDVDHVVRALAEEHLWVDHVVEFAPFAPLPPQRAKRVGLARPRGAVPKDELTTVAGSELGAREPRQPIAYARRVIGFDLAQRRHGYRARAAAGTVRRARPEPNRDLRALGRLRCRERRPQPALDLVGSLGVLGGDVDVGRAASERDEGEGELSVQRREVEERRLHTVRADGRLRVGEDGVEGLGRSSPLRCGGVPETVPKHGLGELGLAELGQAETFGDPQRAPWELGRGGAGWLRCHGLGHRGFGALM